MYLIAFDPRAGQKVFTAQGAMPRDTAFTQALCADMQGFSLHAAVRCGADERQRLEQLCRYITRPAQDRRTRAVQQRRTGRAQAEDCVARRHHAHRDVATGVHAAAGRAGAPAAAAPDPIGVRVTSLREVSGLPLREPWGAGTQRQAAGAGGAGRTRRGRWRVGANGDRVRLRARPAGAHQLGPAPQEGFDIDMEHCPNCGGQLKIIAAILEAPVIERIPTHLGLQARAPPRAPARGDFRHAA